MRPITFWMWRPILDDLKLSFMVTQPGQVLFPQLTPAIVLTMGALQESSQ